MKTLFARKAWSVLVAGTLLATPIQLATAQIATAPTVVVDNQPVAVHLSPGVPEILKLSAAHVGDDAIVAYIAGSGNTYSLDVNEIVYLKNQGVSDHVLAAMLNQPKRTVEVVTQTAAAAPTTAPATTTTTTSVYANAPGAQFAPAVTQTAAYYAPAGTTTYAYPGYYPSSYAGYPYYGGYYGYGYPGVSLGVGVGLGCGWGLGVGIGVGCGWGGYYGGYYRGCGWGWGGCGYRGYCGFGGCGYRGGFCRR